MLKITKLLLLLVICSSFAAIKPKKDKSVGHIENGKYIVDDAELCKKNVLQDLVPTFENLSIDSVTIEATTTIGEKSEKVYILLYNDIKNSRRIAKYLFLRGEKFYLFEDIKIKKSEKDNTNEAFFMSYAICYGTDAPECTPHIAIIEGEKVWGSSDKLVCKPDDPCKFSNTIVIPSEN